MCDGVGVPTSAEMSNQMSLTRYILATISVSHTHFWGSSLVNSFHLEVIWGGLCDLGSNVPNWCKPNQSTQRQHLPKVCVQQFHGQDEDWFRVFWALLVHFGLGIMSKEGIYQIWILGFLRSKRSNLEVWKKWGVDVEMSLYLRRCKYLWKKYIDEM